MNLLLRRSLFPDPETVRQGRIKIIPDPGLPRMKVRRPCRRQGSSLRCRPQTFVKMCHTHSNVPAIRKVAFAACSRLAREIGLQVTPFLRPLSDPLGYTAGVNVPADRKAAKRPAPATWRYNAWFSASPGIGPQVTFPSFIHSIRQVKLFKEVSDER